jgi:hypothetical protein
MDVRAWTTGRTVGRKETVAKIKAFVAQTRFSRSMPVLLLSNVRPTFRGEVLAGERREVRKLRPQFRTALSRRRRYYSPGNFFDFRVGTYRPVLPEVRTYFDVLATAEWSCKDATLGCQPRRPAFGQILGAAKRFVLAGYVWRDGFLAKMVRLEELGSLVLSVWKV